MSTRHPFIRDTLTRSRRGGGCVDDVRGLVTEGRDGPVVNELTRYQGMIPVNHLTAERVNPDGQDAASEFSDLSTSAQYAVVKAVARGVFFSWQSSDIPRELHRRVVRFGDQQFRCVSHQFSYSPGYELPKGWDRAVTLTAERDSGELHLRLTNTGERSVEILYPEAPPFGALIAVKPDDSVVLSHLDYETNSHIEVIDEIVHSTWFDGFSELFNHEQPPEPREKLHEGVDNALRATYSLPTDVSSDHTVRLQLPLLLDGNYSIGDWELSKLT